jgi:ribonuclease HI
MSQTLKLFTDGGARGNPGPAGTGYVVYSGAGIILEKCGNYLGVATNNQAEYQALIDGLTWLTRHHPSSKVDIYLDSLLIVNQLKGLFKVKHPQLFPLYQQARGLLGLLGSYTISHVPRAQNSVADSLVNQAIDLALS